MILRKGKDVGGHPMSIDEQPHQRPVPRKKDNRLIPGVALLGTVFIVSAAATFAGLVYFYRDTSWGFFVLVIVGLYVFGGISFMPWRTPLRKAFSTGVFLAVAVGLAIFFFDLKQQRAEPSLDAPSFHPNSIK